MLPEAFHAVDDWDKSSRTGAESDYAFGGFQHVFLAVAGVASLSLAADGECCVLGIATISFLVRKKPRAYLPGIQAGRRGWCDCYISSPEYEYEYHCSCRRQELVPLVLGGKSEKLMIRSNEVVASVSTPGFVLPRVGLCGMRWPRSLRWTVADQW